MATENILGGEDRFGSPVDDLDFEADIGQEDKAPSSVGDAVRAALDKARTEAGEEHADRPADGRSRDDRGRFSPKDGEAVEKPQRQARAGQQAPQGQQEATPQQAQNEPLVIKPPVGWSASAKAQFARLPADVQESVARREAEVNNGFRVLQDYKGLEEFTPIIRASNTTHAEVMRRAIDWERSLKTNPVQTVLHVARLAGVDIGRIAQMQGQQAPQQQRAPQQTQMGIDPRQIEQLVQRQIAEREAYSTAEKFLADPANVHAEAVADHMAALITSGQAKDLKDAYDKACWANPEIRPLLINQQRQTAAVNGSQRNRQVVNQARSAARAVTGAPSGHQPVNQQAQPATVRDAIRAAISAQRDA